MKKRNKILIIMSIAFVAVALIAFVAGFAIAGFDILAWFGSKYAMLTYIILGSWALLIAFILISDWIKRM